MTSVDFASCLQFFITDCAQTKLSMNLKFGRNVVKALFKLEWSCFFRKILIFTFNFSSPRGAILRLGQLGYSSCDAKWTVFCQIFMRLLFEIWKEHEICYFLLLTALKKMHYFLRYLTVKFDTFLTIPTSDTCWFCKLFTIFHHRLCSN